MIKIFSVVNLSKESPQKDSHAQSPADALNIMRVLQQMGADYVDLGARSSYSKSEQLDDKIEFERLDSFFAIPRSEGFIPISLDTWSDVNACAFLSKIDVLNYTSTYFPDKLVSDLVSTGCSLVLNYLPATNPYELRKTDYTPPSTEAIFEYFNTMVPKLKKEGVKILAIDPNLGMWHPDVPEDLKPIFQRNIIETIPKLKKLAPVFIVAPRTKGFLNIELVELIISKGVEFLRTHDLVAIKEVIRES